MSSGSLSLMASVSCHAQGGNYIRSGNVGSLNGRLVYIGGRTSHGGLGVEVVGRLADT